MPSLLEDPELESRATSSEIASEPTTSPQSSEDMRVNPAITQQLQDDPVEEFDAEGEAEAEPQQTGMDEAVGGAAVVGGTEVATAPTQDRGVIQNPLPIQPNQPRQVNLSTQPAKLANPANPNAQADPSLNQAKSGQAATTQPSNARRYLDIQNKAPEQGESKLFKAARNIHDGAKLANPANLKNAASQVANKAKQEAMNKVKDLAKQEAQKALAAAGPWGTVAAGAIELLDRLRTKEGRQQILAILCIPIAILLSAMFIFLGIFSGIALSRKGFKPASVAVTTNAAFSGVHCSDMASTLTVDTGHGTAVNLQISTNFGTGQFWTEDDTRTDPSTGGLPLYNYNYAGKQPTDPQYFVNTRWPYTATMFSDPNMPNQLSESSISSQYFKGEVVSGKYYAGKKIIVFNPKNGKAIILLALGYGPAPYTAWTQDLTQQASQKQAWDTAPGTIHGFRLTDPPGFTGRVIGFTAAMRDKLGIQDGDNVVYGFATGASALYTPGYVWQCPVVSSSLQSDVSSIGGKDVQNDSKSNNAGTPHFVDNVPAVRQASNSDCGKAAVAMLLMHYGGTTTDMVTTDSNGHVVNTENICYQSLSTALNSHLTKDPTTGETIIFNDVTMNGADAISAIKSSIDKDNPVIAALQADSTYGQHFVVVDGYDDKNFYISDPFPWDVSDATKGIQHIYTDRDHTSSHTTLDFNSFASNLRSDTYNLILRQ